MRRVQEGTHVPVADRITSDTIFHLLSCFRVNQYATKKERKKKTMASNFLKDLEGEKAVGEYMLSNLWS